MIEFGTEARPLRPSSLGKLLKCEAQVVITQGMESEGNEGTQTGSLFHKAVEGFHRGGDSEAAGLEAMEGSIPSFPLSDPPRARVWYNAYAKDPTNFGTIAKIRVTDHMRAWKPVWEGEVNGELLAVELPVRLIYKSVHIIGTLDQIRFTDGIHSVWDLKTSKGFHSPEETVEEHTFQQAAYVLAARQTTGIDVQPGGIVYSHGYLLPRGRRFIPAGVTLKQCEEAMDVIVRRVEMIRKYGASFTPSAESCKFCPVKRFPSCTQRLPA